MGILLRSGAIFIIAVKRLFSQRRLALVTLVGLTAAVALTMSVPLYADAVYYRILREALSMGVGGDTTNPSVRPPFAFMFRYIGAWHGAVTWEDTQPLDQFLTTQGAAALGLPQKAIVRYFRTDNFGLYPGQSDSAYLDNKKPLGWVNFATISNLEPHITLLEGTFPAVASTSPDSTVDILVSEARATELGLQVGEIYTAFQRFEAEEGEAARRVQVPVRISGIWKATDPKEEFWFYNPLTLEDNLLVPEATFTTRISPQIKKGVYLGLWYLNLDGSAVRSEDANTLLGRIIGVQQRIAALLPNSSLDVSPSEALAKYQREAAVLTILLYAFAVPIVGLILAFIGLAVGLTVNEQRNEIAVLRSRGATIFQIMGIAFLQALILGGLAFALAWPASQAIARVIGRARSFLNFTSAGADLPVQMTWGAIRFGLLIIVVALIAQIVPSISAARHTIVTYKQERARSMRASWWQRMGLDLFLFIPAAYGAYLLRKQGAIALPGVEGTFVSNDPFQNPLLFLVPALGIFALTLFILRVLPWVMSVIVWLTSHTHSVGTLMAARHLARSPGFYNAPLVLLVLTLSLSAFTASLAQTLDNHLYDQTYYSTGADMALVEMGESTETSKTGMSFESSSTGTGGTEEQKDAGPKWLFLPVSEHLKVPGVEGAARVGRYTTTTRLSGATQSGIFMGVDRTDFGRVAFWRDDFAPSSLGTLMNALALTPEGILAPRDFLAQNALAVGDTVRISVSVYGQPADVDFKIVGDFDLFPTWYPADGPLFVGNLDYIFERAGGEFPYDVWLKVAPDASYYKVAEGITNINLRVLDWKASLLEVAKEQERPQRQGLFGLLSVGFAAAALLTVLGFLLYALFSFRRRFIELGILRAIGLSSFQMTSFLAWELAFLILTGIIAGTAFGAWVSELFIPYLQVGSGPGARIPPFLVEIAWPAIFRIYALFGLIFLVALGGLAALLMRMKIFQAIKLGETA